MIYIELTVMIMRKTKAGDDFFSSILSDGEEPIWVNVFYKPDVLMINEVRPGNKVFIKGMLTVVSKNGRVYLSISANSIDVKRYKSTRDEDVAKEVDRKKLF